MRFFHVIVIPLLTAISPAVRGAQSDQSPPEEQIPLHQILSAADSGDGTLPNPGGYDKMARAWVPAILAVLGS
jgi:hypothetical protein